LISDRKMACLASVISAVARLGCRTMVQNADLTDDVEAAVGKGKRFASAELDLPDGNGALGLPYPDPRRHKLDALEGDPGIAA
jgi:hypothetical protein